MTTPFILHRDAAMLEADMLDVCDLCFEDQPFPDYRPILKRFAGRVGQLADKIKELEELTADQRKNAARWELLFNTTGIFWNDYKDGWKIFREIPNGVKLIGAAKTLSEAADKALGFK